MTEGIQDALKIKIVSLKIKRKREKKKQSIKPTEPPNDDSKQNIL